MLCENKAILNVEPNLGVNMKREMLLGSEAIAEGVRLSKPGVIPAYPITPQTHIIEVLSEMVDRLLFLLLQLYQLIILGEHFFLTQM